MRTAVVTDSTAYIPKELREQFDIHMVPLVVNFGTETFSEEVDLTAEEFFERIKTSEKLPTTSQPAIGAFVDLFEKLAKEYDAVITVHLSSGISGTYQGSVAAGQMVEDLKIYSFDSEISCMVQGFYAIEAAKMAQNGAHPDDIIARLDALKQSARAYFMVDDLSHLQRGGRLSSAQAFIGGILQVKPLLHFVDKVIVPYEKIRTRKKALGRIYEIFHDAACMGEPMQAVVIHANREDDAREIMSELAAKYPNVEFSLSYFGPVIATHLGEGALGLGWMKR
ncbi:DegV family protein [Bacillus sp. HMF5848]|uniref:DegV family protein n=1 Tax=Bacillus sp. HMF5848 TaxID=2495421 RepID=UPI000F79B7E2|nr:DegV family protein [Bacillus sp. HMF5848]RSK28630.1 DegV family protein [Bacillus sp. HMF5848]